MTEVFRNPCVLCGGYDDEILGVKDDRTVVRCRRCALVRTLDVPNDYDRTYVDEAVDYHGAWQEASSSTGMNYYQRFDHDLGVANQRFQKLAHYSAPRLLDVGCSNGAFLAAAAERGLRAEGLEPSHRMAAFAREKVGVPVHTDWATVRAPFDIITYHDVIEHVVDPVGELNRAARYLTMDGLVIVDTPDARDPRFKELGLEWHHMRPKEHLWFFDEFSISEVMVRAGFFPPEVNVPIAGKLVAYGRRAR